MRAGALLLGESSDDAAIRSAAQALGGTATFPRRDGVAGPLFDVPAPLQRALLERLKKSFDPDNKLAPLPWQTEPIRT